jgi:large subunit ribosomal protein L4
MATLKLTKPTGRASGSVDVDDALFAVEPNIPLMHQVVTAQLAARRSGTQSTKTRAEVGAAAPSRGARRAPVGPARARSGRRSGGAAASPSGPSPGATPSAPPAR